MRLFSALQSIRLCAAIDPPAIRMQRRIRRKNEAGEIMLMDLFVAQRLHGIKFGCTSRRIQTGNQADQERKENREEYEPQWHCPEMFWWNGLALEPDIRAEVDDLADCPAKTDANHTSDNAHGSGLGEEKFLHIAIASTDGFHDSDFPAAFEDCHHKRVDDTDRRYGQGQAAENA